MAETEAKHEDVTVSTVEEALEALEEGKFVLVMVSG
jgi:hypothetical protein